MTRSRIWWFWVWFIQQFNEIIIDYCFILSIFFSGIPTCAEPDAEREKRGGGERMNIPVSFFKVNANHS